MKKVYETPEADVINFCALERIALEDRRADDDVILDGSTGTRPRG